MGETPWKVEIDFLTLREVLPVLTQNFLTLILDTILNEFVDLDFKSEV